MSHSPERGGPERGDRNTPHPRTEPTPARTPSPSTARPDHAWVLGLQRTAGNRVVQQWMSGGAPTQHLTGGPVSDPAVQRAKVAHTTGKQVDAYASASAFLKGYVESKIKGGTKAEGNVHIHPGADFKKEWVTYAMARLNPATGATYTKAEAEAQEPSINAFRDGSEIHIHEERGETGTAIHESMHLYSHDTFKSTVGFNANEGATEYFARIIYAEQKIKRGAYYTSQLAAVQKLVTATSKDKLADGYFNGTLKGLEDGAEAKAKGTWAKWVDYMKKGKYSSANALW